MCVGRRYLLDSADKTQLSECGDTIVASDLFANLAVLKTQYRRSGEVHLAARRSLQSPRREDGEGRPSVSAATDPTTNDIVPFGDEICRAAEAEVWERGAEIGHERLDVCVSPTRLMQ